MVFVEDAYLMNNEAYIVRVFPRRTNATPRDDMAFVGEPPLPAFQPEADRVHVSVVFDWDKDEGERLGECWRSYYEDVKVGGPAYSASGPFVPGQYLREGYVITSRGCPNDCWFCEVKHRSPQFEELPIVGGWNVQDDNLLACSEEHIRAVFAMLKQQTHAIHFDGGLEAAHLKPWHIDLLLSLNLGQMFLAYDERADLPPLRLAAQLLADAGLMRGHKARCYVLIGYPGDLMSKAEERLQIVMQLGFMPFAMLYRDRTGAYQKSWRRFQREWANPVIVGAKMK